MGIDGCRGGWAVVSIAQDGRKTFAVHQHFQEVGALGADITLVDIPIGLPDSGYRACDRAARALLGRARSRVFLGARRPLLDLRDDYAAANAWGKAAGAGVSRQMYCILPKIAEVDAVVTPASQERVRESHPEVAFCRLAGHPLPSKGSPEGRRQRRDLLAKAGFTEIDAWLETVRRRVVEEDDVLDAAVCALAALDLAEGNGRRLDCVPEADAKGLRMEMWF